MIVLATAALLVVIAIAGLGATSSGPIGWAGDTQLFTHPTIPLDRVLTGTIRNDSTHTLRVDIGDVRVLTSDGEVVPSTPVFLKTFGKTLWAAGRGPQQVPDTELLRTGRIALLSPGEEVPLYESYFWRYATGLLVALRESPAVSDDRRYQSRFRTDRTGP